MSALRTLFAASLIAASAVTALPAFMTASAQAESEQVTIYRSDGRVLHCGQRGYCQPRSWRYHRGYHHHHKRFDDERAAVILGLTGLAIVGGAIASSADPYGHHSKEPGHHRHRSPRDDR